MSTRAKNHENEIISKGLNRQIGLYSVAAAVAGVSMLALAEPAGAEVVVTKKTIPIPMGTVTMPIAVKISMANNGVDNFVFGLTNSSNPLEPNRFLAVGGDSPTDGVLGKSFFYANASALPRGARIGPLDSSNRLFGSNVGLMAVSYTAGSRISKGNWAGHLKNHYLGVRFQINGEFHYGWIRVTVTSSSQKGAPFLTATITGYAYETIPNKAILAGTAGTAAAIAESLPRMRRAGPSLGMLAAGAEGMPLWRRELTASSK